MNKFRTDDNIYLKSRIHIRSIMGLDILTLNYCNLNCKWCSRWCNITKNKQIYRAEDIIRDVLHISNNTDTLSYLTLTGGEPLLHPNITEIVKFLGEYHKWHNECGIFLQTNLVSIPQMPDEFFKAVRDADLTISYVQYNCKHINYPEIFKRLKDEKIKYISTLYLGDISLDDNPVTDTFLAKKYSTVKNSSTFDLKTWFLCCDATGCLWQHKLYRCILLPFIDTLTDNFNAKFEIVENDDYINVENINRNSCIHSWKNKPCHFCKNYCYNKQVTYVDWSQGRNTKEELIFENE